MIIDMSCIRIKSCSLVNNAIFEIRMKGYKVDRKRTVSLMSAAGIMFIYNPSSRGLHSIEIMDQVRADGDFIGACIFGLMPVVQQLQINDLKMINTYVKNKMSA